MTLFIRHSFQFLSWIRCEKWEDGKANVLWKYIYTRRSKGENMDKLILRIFPIRIAAWHWYFPYELDYFTYWFFLFFHTYIIGFFLSFTYVTLSICMYIYMYTYRYAFSCSMFLSIFSLIYPILPLHGLRFPIKIDWMLTKTSS
jgi:hypothetical protein